jgi:hypothetical protein
MRKYCTARQAADDNMAHAHWMPDNHGYRHKHRVYNNCCFSMARVVARMRLNVTFINKLVFFFLSKGNGRNMIKNLCWSSCKLFVVFVLFYWNLYFFDSFSKNTQISNFIKKILSVVADLHQSDGQTDRHAKGNSRFSQYYERA